MQVTTNKLSAGGFAAVMTGYDEFDRETWETVRVGRITSVNTINADDYGHVEIKFENGDWMNIPVNQLDYVWKADLHGYVTHGYESPEWP